MRREQGGRRARQQLAVSGQQGDPVGIDQHREAGRQDRREQAGGDPSVPMPGPAAQASTWPAASMAALPPRPSPRVVMTASGQCCLTTPTGTSDDTSRTIPAPPRMAPPTASGGHR